MEDNKLVISEKYIDEILDACFRSLVGEQMKRFEILSDKKEIKKACKELVYEKQRELKALLKAFNSGVKFITPIIDKEN
jgi:hypothetical protein